MEVRFESAANFAARAGLNERHVTALLRSGRLPGLKFGLKWRVDLAGVERLCQAHGGVRPPR